MNSVNELHNKSMEYAELALLEKLKDNQKESKKYFRESLQYELKAIEILDNSQKVEPTYSVLHRSAAILALDCNEPQIAEQIIAKALAQNPPDEIDEELRGLLEQVNSTNNLPYEVYVNGKLFAKYQTKELAYKMGMAYHNALESRWESIGGSTHDLIRPCSVVIKTKYFRSNHGK